MIDFRVHCTNVLFVARDMWKKKYFNEKKKHPPLEERINTLRSELDQMHKKTIQTMEAEAKYAAQMGYTKEAANGVRRLVPISENSSVCFGCVELHRTSHTYEL